jgi:hypothetical protein
MYYDEDRRLYPILSEFHLKEAVILARDIGAKGLQPYVTKGLLAPENLSKQQRKEILKFVKTTGWFSRLSAPTSI